MTDKKKEVVSLPYPFEDVATQASRLKEHWLWGECERLLNNVAERKSTLFLTKEEVETAREILIYRQQHPEPKPKHPDIERALKNYPNRWA